MSAGDATPRKSCWASVFRGHGADNALERLDANRRKVIAESAAVDDARSNREDPNRQHADAADAVAKAQRMLTGN